MKKTKIGIFLISLLIVSLVASVFVLAKPDVMPDKARNPVIIPAHAVEVAPGVFYLGKALDKGRIVEGYAMFVKPETECGNGICEPGENARKCPEDCEGEVPEEPDTSSCYEFLARGAKWRIVEPYMVGMNINGNILSSSIEKWENAADYNILGGEIAGIVDGADLVSPDNKNEVYFADIEESGVIAVAIVWGYFSGPPFARELVEWDMVFDDVSFNWSETGETNKMDFENIATHELGHAVGLGDLYNTECSDQTMYGYSTKGEIKKRTLESGDIAGIQKLYGI